MSTGLLGRPSSQSEAVAAVGPVVAGGYVAMADGTLGLLPGLLDRPYRPDDLPRSMDTRAAESRGDSSAAASDATIPGGPAEGRIGDAEPDQLALDRVDRITELAARLGRWFAAGRSDRRINALGRKPRLSRNDPRRACRRCWPERDSIGSATRVPIASSMPSWEYRPRWCSSRPRRTGYASSRPAGGEGLGGLRPPDRYAGRLAPGPHAPRRKPGVSAGSPTAARH